MSEKQKLPFATKEGQEVIEAMTEAGRRLIALYPAVLDELKVDCFYGDGRLAFSFWIRSAERQRELDELPLDGLDGARPDEF